MSPPTTIVAISSSPRPAARIIIRCSGPGALHALRALEVRPLDLTPGARSISLPIPRLLALPSDVPSGFRDTNPPGLRVWLYLFRQPNSYTGEDVFELHLPGNPFIAEAYVQELTTAGCRPAGPGEFTARAYFNGRMDLSAAEGVMAVINAASDAELKAARQLQSGVVFRAVETVKKRVLTVLALLEAEIDFSDEAVTFIDRDHLRQTLLTVAADLKALIGQDSALSGDSNPPTVVLVGRPNAGKSTLLNWLSESRRVVTSASPGTTRDAVAVDLKLAEVHVRLVDTAGLEQDYRRSGVPAGIGAAMRSQCHAAIESADVVVEVVDGVLKVERLLLPRPADFVVYTKCDLAGSTAGHHNDDELRVSAVANVGREELLARIARSVRSAVSPELSTVTARHRLALCAALAELEAARLSADDSVELLAGRLRQAADELGTITGGTSPDDVLGEIFGGFCIGK